jgi:hypothetical protein
VARRTDSSSPLSRLLYATSCAAKMAGVGANRRELTSRKVDPPWRARQIRKRPTSQTLQPWSLHEGRYPASARLLSYGTSAVRSMMRSMGARLQHPLRLPHASRPQAQRQQVAPDNRLTQTQQLLRGVKHVMRINTQAPPPLVPPGRLIHLPRPRGRLLHPRHQRGGPRLLHIELPWRTLAPYVPSYRLVRVRLLLL